MYLMAVVCPHQPTNGKSLVCFYAQWAFLANFMAASQLLNSQFYRLFPKQAVLSISISSVSDQQRGGSAISASLTAPISLEAEMKSWASVHRDSFVPEDSLGVIGFEPCTYPSFLSTKIQHLQIGQKHF